MSNHIFSFWSFKPGTGTFPFVLLIFTVRNLQIYHVFPSHQIDDTGNDGLIILATHCTDQPLQLSSLLGDLLGITTMVQNDG